MQQMGTLVLRLRLPLPREVVVVVSQVTDILDYIIRLTTMRERGPKSFAAAAAAAAALEAQ